MADYLWQIDVNGVGRVVRTYNIPNGDWQDMCFDGKDLYLLSNKELFQFSVDDKAGAVNNLKEVYSSPTLARGVAYNGQHFIVSRL